MRKKNCSGEGFGSDEGRVLRYEGFGGVEMQLVKS